MKTITTATRTAPYTIKCAAATLALALLAACTPHATDEPATAHPVALMPTATIVSHGTATRADATPTDKVDITLYNATLKLTMGTDTKTYTMDMSGNLISATPHKATVGKHNFSVEEAKVAANVQSTTTTYLPMNLNVAMQPAKNIDVPPSGTVDLPLTPTTAGMRLVLNMDAGVKPTSVTCVPSNEKATVGGVDPYNASSIVLLYNNTSTGVNTHAVAFGMLPAGTDIKAGVPLAAITTETGSTTKNLALYPPTNLTLNAGDMVTYTVHVGHSVASITDVKIGGFTEIDGGNIGVGDANLAIADGTATLDPAIFNASKPMWLITGNTDAVITNVVKALTDLDTYEGETPSTPTASIEVILQDFASTIGADKDFSGCKALASISAPKATGIEMSTFSECEALTTASLPAAETIGMNAFNGCKALTTVSLPKAATIKSNAFFDCTALETISLPAATSIGANVFNGCSALDRLELTGTAKMTVGNNTFGSANTYAITLVLNSKATNAAIGVTVDPSDPNKVTFKTDAAGTDGFPVTFKAVTYLNN